MHDAKTHLSRLVEEVAASGESIILAKAGKPIAEIIPYRARKKPEFGFAAKQLGTIDLEEFDRLDEEIRAMFDPDWFAFQSK